MMSHSNNENPASHQRRPADPFCPITDHHVLHGQQMKCNHDLSYIYTTFIPTHYVCLSIVPHLNDSFISISFYIMRALYVFACSLCKTLWPVLHSDCISIKQMTGLWTCSRSPPTGEFFLVINPPGLLCSVSVVFACGLVL